MIDLLYERAYEDVLEDFYQERGINFSFSEELGRYLTGWGDGALTCSIQDYLKFTELPSIEAHFDRLRGGGLFYSGFVPGFETVCAFSKEAKLIYFMEALKSPFIPTSF